MGEISLLTSPHTRREKTVSRMSRYGAFKSFKEVKVDWLRNNHKKRRFPGAFQKSSVSRARMRCLWFGGGANRAQGELLTATKSSNIGEWWRTSALGKLDEETSLCDHAFSCLWGWNEFQSRLVSAKKRCFASIFRITSLWYSRSFGKKESWFPRFCRWTAVLERFPAFCQQRLQDMHRILRIPVLQI